MFFTSHLFFLHIFFLFFSHILFKKLNCHLSSVTNKKYYI